MILLDMNQVMVAALMARIHKEKIKEIEEDMFRHMVLNSIRANLVKFRREYGELIICCDGRQTWRKDVFPYYKAKRKANQKASDVDWDRVYTIFNKIREEVKENFPYRVIHMDHAEADDIIASFCHEYGTKFLGGAKEPILILSGDHDFKQLQVYRNVKQYSPVQKVWLDTKNPKAYKIEHIMRGDDGDGVPNIKSDDDAILDDNKRQSPVYQKWVDEVVANFEFGLTPKDVFTEQQLRNWQRNEKLVDLDMIPEWIKEETAKQYEAEAGKNRSKLMDYFMEHNLKNLTESMSEF